MSDELTQSEKVPDETPPLQLEPECLKILPG